MITCILGWQAFCFDMCLDFVVSSGLPDHVALLLMLLLAPAVLLGAEEWVPSNNSSLLAGLGKTCRPGTWSMPLLAHLLGA